MKDKMARGAVIEVPCTVDIAHLPENLHAHVDLCGIEVEPGDTVLVQELPVDVRFGEHRVISRRATVVRAGALRRWWTRLTGGFAIATLWEVGFSPASLPATIKRSKP